MVPSLVHNTTSRRRKMTHFGIKIQIMSMKSIINICVLFNPMYENLFFNDYVSRNTIEKLKITKTYWLYVMNKNIFLDCLFWLILHYFEASIHIPTNNPHFSETKGSTKHYPKQTTPNYITFYQTNISDLNPQKNPKYIHNSQTHHNTTKNILTTFSFTSNLRSSPTPLKGINHPPSQHYPL